MHHHLSSRPEPKAVPYHPMANEIEPLTDASFDAALTIWVKGWHEAHGEIVPKSLLALRTEENFRSRLRALQPGTRVVRASGAVAGLVIVAKDEINQLYVAPTARGGGIAQALIADAEAEIRAAGHAQAWLACAIGNTRAARFYTRCGWVNAGIVAVPVDTADGPYPLDVWRFEKNL